MWNNSATQRKRRTMWVLNGNRIVSCVALLALIGLVAGCRSENQSSLEPELLARAQTRTWVAIEPTQCLGNAWEADWLERHGGEYGSYPKDPATPGLEREEIAIITSYYARQGVVVFETSTAPKYVAVCLSCACPEGHTMFLQVREGDVDTMVGFGYRVEAPPTVV